MAHQYFADDKRLLLVTLEYIADQKNKALKGAYKKNVIIRDIDLRTDSWGTSIVIGRVLNKGNPSKSLTWGSTESEEEGPTGLSPE